jgi:hypothetical protein
MHTLSTSYTLSFKLTPHSAPQTKYTYYALVEAIYEALVVAAFLLVGESTEEQKKVLLGNRRERYQLHFAAGDTDLVTHTSCIRSRRV